MNLGAPELNLTTDKLQEIVGDSTGVDKILDTFGVPRTDTFTASSFNLLPSNYIVYDENGMPSVLPKTTFEETLNKNILNITDTVKDNVEVSISEAISVKGQLGIQQDKEELEILADKVRSDVDKIIEKTQNFIIALNSFYKNNVVVANYKNTIDRVIKENIDKLTNKDKRDISDNKEFFDRVSSSIITSVLSSLKEDVIKQINLATKPNNTAQIAANSSLINSFEDKYPLSVYLRVYFTVGEGADPETFDGLTTMNTRLMSGRTCAVDNSTIPINSVIVMPDGREFVAMDTFSGSSVRPAVYLYFHTREEAENYLKSLNYNITNKLNVVVVPPSKPPAVKSYNKPSNVSIRGTNKKLV